MGKISATRTIAISSLGLLIGLIAARVPYFAAGGVPFSWPGFFLGIGAVALAYLLSRPIAKAANTNPPGTAAQRRFLHSALWFFLVTLVLFTGFIYTGFVWLKLPLFLAIIGGVVSVFAGMVSAFSATRHDA